MRICVFCSSSAGLPEIYIDAAYELGRRVAQRGHTLVFGGFEEGTMGDVARGAADAGGEVIGIMDETLARAGRRAFSPMQAETMPNLAQRKARMIELADAFAVLPGGLGTFDELFSVLSAAKVGEMHAKTAIVNVNGYYDPLIEMLDRATKTGLNSNNWRDDAGAFATVDEALDYLEGTFSCGM